MSYKFGPKCTLAASHVAPCHGEYADGTDGQTDGRTPDRYITLSATDEVAVIIGAGVRT